MRFSAATRLETLTGLVRARNGSQWCLFIDRDGVINRRVVGGYVCSWEGFELLPGVLDALTIIADWAPKVVVVTNQQGVGKGVMTAEDLAYIHSMMLIEMVAENVHVDAVLACTHLVEEGCRCRKPAPGLALDWLAAHPYIDRSLSLMVGDSDTDMGMAHALRRATGGCAAIRVGCDLGTDGTADATYGSLADFAGEVRDVLETEAK